MQLIQNDALRFCDNVRLKDRKSLDEMHKKAKLSSLEQRRCIQLLQLMYRKSKKFGVRKIGARNTRQNDKFVFKMDNKIGTKYSHSPFYKGNKIWDLLSIEVQFSAFKNAVKTLYKDYIKDFYV